VAAALNVLKQRPGVPLQGLCAYGCLKYKATKPGDAVHAGLETLEPYWAELNARVARLARRRQQYADLFDFAPLAAVITDVRGIIQEANCAMGALVGRRPAFLAGKPLVALVERGSQRGFFTNLLGGAPAWTSALRTAAGQVEVRLSVRRMPSGLCWSLAP
jgi:hypothetical protein